MLSRIKRNGLTLLGFGVGLIGGFLYWYFIGCSNGMCAIKSNPFSMTLYGAMLGALVGNFFQQIVNKEMDKK